MTESLTKRRIKVVEEAKDTFDFENVWTQKGVVYCSFKGKKNMLFITFQIFMKVQLFLKKRNIYISA